jgi:hypothetical protein
MNLDRQLRSVLSEEADMQNAPAPDVDRLIIGGKARRRRRNLARVRVAAAAVVLVAGGVYGVTKVGSATTVEPADAPSRTATPTTSTDPYLDNGTTIGPGTYQMVAGLDATNVAINADVTFGAAGWSADNYPVLSDGSRRYGGLAIYRPSGLAAGTGCVTDPANTHVGHTPQSVAQQLAQLPRSTVVLPPTPVEAFGRHAVHLRLRINQHCGRSVYRVAETINGGHGISYGNASRDVVIDFWVEDVRGVPVVVETWHQVGASSRLTHRITSAKNSIEFGG